MALYPLSIPVLFENFLRGPLSQNFSELLKKISRTLDTLWVLPWALARDEFKPKEQGQDRSSKLDPYKEDISELLGKYPRLSSPRVLEEKRKRGYQGSLALLKIYLKKLRVGRKEPFLRIETLVGEHYGKKEIMLS